ncbi:Predicted metal-dependent enzyme of the double-stranded beta helix superfamily [Syntrophus gentianae]|uniref:Predicted metal-dependent enzyme of the double-stranded beta helix superfamily n=1 Tax=Syntrophus gentianae TaxID=43775 RepID=A0A1H7WEN1_9BACT|nr:cysteine dioxygenase family protein [Syntrophus gentianae]SEM19525.1 Predicted metal-dependent enzyme of the double-stranded beta helix superfamily [Syntrophus gentianae]
MELNEFVESLTTLLREEPSTAEKIRRGRALLSRLTISVDWFRENMARLLLDQTWRANQRPSIWPNEVTIAWGADPEFSMLAYIWEPGRVDTVHDHGSWGVVATLSGTIDEIKYSRLDDGSREAFADLRPHSPTVLNPGDTTPILPLDAGIHRLGNLAQGYSITIHVYGKPVRRGYIRYFYPEEKRVTVVYPPPTHKAALAIRSLADIRAPWAEDLLKTALRENVPDFLKKECEEALSRRTEKTEPQQE